MPEDELPEQEELDQRGELPPEKFWKKFRRRFRFIAAIIIIVIAIGTFTGALQSIWSLFFPSKPEPVVLPPDYPLRERCDLGNLPKDIFKHEGSTKVLIAAFAGGTPETKRAGAELSLRIDEQLERFVIDSLKLSPGDLETYRLDCIIEGHDEAQEIMDSIGADLVIWGNNYCFNDQTKAKFCPKATLTKRTSEIRAFGEDIPMVNITDLDLPNLLAEEPYQLLCLVAGLHFHIRDKHKEAVVYFEKAREKLYSDEKGVENIHYYIGMSNFYVSNYREALNRFTTAWEGFKKSDNLQRQSACLNNIGTVYESWGQYEKAIEYYQKSLGICKDIGGRKNEAVTFNNMGEVHRSWGQYEKAIEYFQKSLKIQEEIGDRQGEAVTLNNIGLVYDSWGQYEKAIEYYQKSSKIQEEIGDRQGEAVTLNNIGSVYYSWGQCEKAIEYYQKSLKIKEEIGDRQGEAVTLNNIGGVYDSWGQYEKALEYTQKSLQILEEIGAKAEAQKVRENLESLKAEMGKK